MEEVSIIGIDLAKRSFQVHGAKADGSVAYRGQTVDNDGIGKTSKWRRACEPAFPIWIRSHEHHTGPRPTRAASRGRTYDST